MSEDSINTDPEELLQAAVVSAKAGNFGDLRVIVECLKHPDHEVRMEAAYCCEQIGFPGAIDGADEMALHDPASDNRNQAIYALAAIGLPKVIPILVAALNDDDESRWSDAQTALYRILGKQVLPLLPDDRETARDRDQAKRISAWWEERSKRFKSDHVYYMGELASPGSFIQQLKVTNTVLPDAILDPLRDWTGQDFGQQPLSEVVSKWEEWWRQNSGNYVPGRRYYYSHLVPLSLP